MLLYKISMKYYVNIRLENPVLCQHLQHLTADQQTEEELLEIEVACFMEQTWKTIGLVNLIHDIQEYCARKSYVVVVPMLNLNTGKFWNMMLQ